MAIRWMVTRQKKAWRWPHLDLEVHTSDPVKLYIHHFIREPLKRLEYRTFRGFTHRHWPAFFIIDPVTAPSHESTETTVHTFTIPDWEECMTRWWYFSATKGGFETDSISPMFSAHAVKPPPPFGTVLRAAIPPSLDPTGIGGSERVIWYCDEDEIRVYELSVVDFSAIRSARAPGTFSQDIGGTEAVIWHCDSGIDKVYELSVVDLSAIRIAGPPTTGPQGIGGTERVIWHAENRRWRVYELSPITLGAIRYARAPGRWPAGAGGDEKFFWHVPDKGALMYDLSPTDFSVRRTAGTPGSWAEGIGGKEKVIWHTNKSPIRVFEIATGY